MENQDAFSDSFLPNESSRIGLMIILHDVTREKEIEKMKSEFVSIAAHQLRTPLTSIKWAIRSMLDGDLGSVNTDQQKILEQSFHINERTIGLVNDLLNVARIEENRFIYQIIKFSLDEIVQKNVDNLKLA